MRKTEIDELLIIKIEIPPPALRIKMSTILIAALCGVTAVVFAICLTQPPSNLVSCFRHIMGH